MVRLALPPALGASPQQGKGQGTGRPPPAKLADHPHRRSKRTTDERFGLAVRRGEARNADTLIALALAEDLAQVGDITCTATIPSQARGTARFVARAAGVLAGLSVAGRLAGHFQLDSQWRPHLIDGERLDRGSVIAEIAGPVRSILALERTALNFLQRLSGIATLTARFVAAVEGTRAVILDTRKTTPGWRMLEKYAVRCGGGHNHRMGLHDAVLIKDNHLAYLQSQSGPDAIAAAVAAASPCSAIGVHRGRGRLARAARPCTAVRPRHHPGG